MSDESKKIFIDEDWKAQVERERAEAQSKQAAEPAGDAVDVDAAVPEEIEGDAYFVNLVSGLAAQCMFACDCRNASSVSSGNTAPECR